MKPGDVKKTALVWPECDNGKRARACVAFLTNHGLLTLEEQARLIEVIFNSETQARLFLSGMWRDRESDK